MLSKYQVIRLTRKFYFDKLHRKIECRELRRDLVNAITEELMDRLDGRADLLSKWTMKHPDFFRSEYTNEVFFSVLDVLADFILKIDQKAEKKSEEYPILGVRKNLRLQYERNEREVNFLQGNSENKEEGDSEQSNGRVPGVYLEHIADPIAKDPLDILLSEDNNAESVEDFTDLIRSAKTNVGYYVVRYADCSPWNAKEKDRMSVGRKYKRRTPTLVRNRILSLQESRIRKCECCGQSFYAHHIGNDRKYCDLVRFNDRFSLCQRKANIAKTLNLAYAN